jgi:predicted  nucleic acid-binding Zn-ribbon protein
VTDNLAVLYSVQQADTEIARLREALTGLDTGTELESQVAAVEAELVTLREERRTAEKESLDCELELRTLEEKRKTFQDQLYGGTVRNPRQLKDLQEEVEMLSREIRKLEDRLLELMETLEARGGEIQEREARLKELQESLEGVRAKYETTGGRLRREIADLESQRKERAAQVKPDLLKRYERIRSRQANLGIVKVTGSTCPGCHVRFPSEVVKALRAGRSELTCESCGRLLFWEE